MGHTNACIIDKILCPWWWQQTRMETLGANTSCVQLGLKGSSDQEQCPTSSIFTGLIIHHHLHQQWHPLPLSLPLLPRHCHRVHCLSLHHQIPFLQLCIAVSQATNGNMSLLMIASTKCVEPTVNSVVGADARIILARPARKTSLRLFPHHLPKLMTHLSTHRFERHQPQPLHQYWFLNPPTLHHQPTNLSTCCRHQPHNMQYRCPWFSPSSRQCYSVPMPISELCKQHYDIMNCNPRTLWGLLHGVKTITNIYCLASHSLLVHVTSKSLNLSSMT